MNRKLAILSAAVVIALLPFAASGMTVALHGETLVVGDSLDGGHAIRYEFRRCMANHLYTFSKVEFDGSVVNEATSDNIGPFLIRGKGWTGGNHLAADGKTPSARTESVEIRGDGQVLARDTVVRASRVDIAVKNKLFDPKCVDSLFCEENVHYVVCRNSIQVEVHLRFANDEPMFVERYYGMQSMTVGETEILTPNGAYGEWTPVGAVDRFTRRSALKFRQFVERTPVCYAALCLCSDGLGDRRCVDGDDVVFIGNSWSKSYHKLIGNRIVEKGETARWKGIYTWFASPVADSHGKFEYEGCFDGREAVFCSESGSDYVVFSDGKKILL